MRNPHTCFRNPVLVNHTLREREPVHLAVYMKMRRTLIKETNWEYGMIGLCSDRSVLWSWRKMRMTRRSFLVEFLLSTIPRVRRDAIASSSSRRGGVLFNHLSRDQHRVAPMLNLHWTSYQSPHHWRNTLPTSLPDDATCIAIGLAEDL